MPDKNDLGIWRAEVDRFRRDCEQGSPADEAERLRQAVGLAPAVIPAPGIEALIEQRAFVSAALALMGPDAPFMLSRSSQGHCLATIAEHGVEATAEGASPALALLGAWAAGLLARTSFAKGSSDVQQANAPERFH